MLEDFYEIRRKLVKAEGAIEKWQKAIREGDKRVSAIYRDDAVVALSAIHDKITTILSSCREMEGE